MIKNNFEILKINFALVFTAILVGLIVSVVAQFFALIAKDVFNLIQSEQILSIFFIAEFGFNFFPLIACLLAGLFICILIRVFKVDRWHGPADTIYAAHQKAGTLDVKRGFLSTIAALFSISGGASVGIYGPLVHFGGTLGAFLRRRSFIPNIPHDIIIGSGVAAAISAGFSSPIAGIIFAHEVILRHFSMKALTAISLASVSASFLAQWLDLVEPALRFKEIKFELINSLPGLIVVGISSAIIAFFFMNSLLIATKIGNSIRLPFYLKPMFPALLCGCFGIFFPEAIGLGSEAIKEVITENKSLYFLISLLIFKIILTSCCIGFGMFGGVLSPALLIGCCVGALVYQIPFLGVDENLGQILAVSGMAAVASSVIGGPITAVILVFELTGSYQYAIASIFSIAISNLITYLIFGSSFFDAQLKLRNIIIGFGREHILMSQTSIVKMIDKNCLYLKKEVLASDALKLFKKFNVTEGYFKDEDSHFLGKLKIISLIGKTNELAFKYREKEIIKLQPSNSILECIQILSNFVGESVPVIDSNSKIIGVISENDILKSYDKISKEIKNIEKS